MPLGKNIIYRYRPISSEKRQRMGINTQGTKTRKDDKIVEVRTDTKRKGDWVFGKTVEVKGTENRRGTVRRSI